MFVFSNGIVDASALGFSLVAYVIGVIGITCIAIAIKTGADARQETRYLTASGIIAKAEPAIYLLFVRSPLFSEYGEKAYDHWRRTYLLSVTALHDERDWALYTSRGQLPLAGTHPAYPASASAIREIECMLQEGSLVGKPIPAALAA